MNALLIHNDYLTARLASQFEQSFKLQAKGGNIDDQIHKQLSSILNTQSYQAIYLPFHFSNNNHRELLGLRIALHIRLTPEFGHVKTPIVFIGHETKGQIAKLSDLGMLLFTTGVFTSNKFDYNSLVKEYDWITQRWRPKISPVLNENEYHKFLHKVPIAAPANYQSHHSVDNELALLRWSEYLQCDHQINEVKQRLQTGLYFKYIKALHPAKPISPGKPYLIKGKAKVLLIDDEANKGWQQFYDCLFQLSPGISCQSLEIDYQSMADSITAAIQKIKAYNPDVVLLDLRLCDEDFSEACQTDPTQLTGYQLLQNIKAFNQGIQVVITTASNKVWSYKSTLKAGANGYIIKQGVSDAAEDIKNLKGVIENAIARANYLKPVFEKITNAQQKINAAVATGKIDADFGNELDKFLDISFQMYASAIHEEGFAFAYLSLFKCLELIGNYFVRQDSESKVWKLRGGLDLKYFQWSSKDKKYDEVTAEKPIIFQKIAACCFQLWGFDIEQDKYFTGAINNSIKRRNQFIHPSNQEQKEWFKKIYTSEGFRELIGQLSKIIDKMS